ncbi:hypothetical protein IHQ76_08920 [Bifidobacterium dentium]|uniref:hypothetical protein n=1 Tax=Bifidobacterium dentium TaxID=1689 RepID=UPI0018C347F8|nr:hypothetical protein [Bifidobacterium dentium]MBF9696913.1 hypothetical protein [Bifidobacterium dentium]MBF9713072.1 hypothetical protein [Bifidobacterium dentium]MBF9715034.1 hypothetical protein [Bifidobacterium dentium]MBF9719011.1 hypothetical protein [Bifidobacterium dentium]
MTATTPIYGLAYPEGTDLVSTAPDSFKSMAETVESALHTVDQRATPEGATPVIATTLAALQDETATIGQTGFVTADGDNTGPYIWDGDSWRHAYWYTTPDKEKTTVLQNTLWVCWYLIKRGFVYVYVFIADTGTTGWKNTQMPVTLPEEARPPIDMSISPAINNNASPGWFNITATGTVSYERRGGTQTSDNRFIYAIWPAS